MTTSYRENVGKYHYCSYWHTWSLVLKADGWDVWELDMVPTNWAHGAHADWARTEAGEVRRHCTPIAAGDRFTDELPAEVQAAMRKYMEQAEHLLCAMS